ncbi:MAG: dihydroneopterin aldolase [Cytophagaceae bacterium]
MAEIEISLNGLEFIAYHGYYEAERTLGNTFSVDVKVWIKEEFDVKEDELQQTVDYEQIYKIVQTVMDKPVKLLETVVGSIINNLFTEFPSVLSAEVKLEKKNPPIGGICRNAAVKIYKKR